MGSRMGPLGKIQPKCLLPISEKTILQQTIENMDSAGCSQIVVVTGHMAELIKHPSITTVHNPNNKQNNILFSLMYAREFMFGPTIVSYSDIWVEPQIYKTLLETPGDLVCAVDIDWQTYYEERTEHPIDEAENVYIRSDNTIDSIGKNVSSIPPQGMQSGEFLGLWRMSKNGAQIFRENFDLLNQRLDPITAFGNAAEWQKAYVSDMLQYLIEMETRVVCAITKRGWAEIDTTQDYDRIYEIARTQCLTTMLASTTNS